jgi:tetratricopeptide (TPR) repeat protein
MRRLATILVVALFAGPVPPASADLLDTCYQATLVEQGHGKEIVELCSRAVNAGLAAKHRAIAHNNRGLGHQRLGNLDAALADFNQAIKLDPNYVYPYDNRGEIYRQRGQFDRAVADYNTAIRMDPTFLSAYLDRAAAYEAMGNVRSALADYDFVLSAPGKDRAIDDWAKRVARIRLDALQKKN